MAAWPVGAMATGQYARVFGYLIPTLSLYRRPLDPLSFSLVLPI